MSTDRPVPIVPSRAELEAEAAADTPFERGIKVGLQLAANAAKERARDQIECDFSTYANMLLLQLAADLNALAGEDRKWLILPLVWEKHCRPTVRWGTLRLTAGPITLGYVSPFSPGYEASGGDLLGGDYTRHQTMDTAKSRLENLVLSLNARR
jgi:hypothetical protein